MIFHYFPKKKRYSYSWKSVASIANEHAGFAYNSISSSHTFRTYSVVIRLCGMRLYEYENSKVNL